MSSQILFAKYYYYDEITEDEVEQRWEHLFRLQVNGPSDGSRRGGGNGDLLKSVFHELSQIYGELVPKYRGTR
jgi:hypothetical protein